MKIRLAGTVEDSIVDGPGLRFVIFVQGCPHGCAGCHNPETHDFSGGYEADTDDLYRLCAENPLTTGVTFSGGEPFCQAQPLYELGIRFKQLGLDIMCYSGWTYEELLKKAESEEYVKKLLSVADYLVDGRFELDKRSLELRFRGSANQRIIDLRESEKLGRAVIAEL